MGKTKDSIIIVWDTITFFLLTFCCVLQFSSSLMSKKFLQPKEENCTCCEIQVNCSFAFRCFECKTNCCIKCINHDKCHECLSEACPRRVSDSGEKEKVKLVVKKGFQFQLFLLGEPVGMCRVKGDIKRLKQQILVQVPEIKPFSFRVGLQASSIIKDDPDDVQLQVAHPYLIRLLKQPEVGVVKLHLFPLIDKNADLADLPHPCSGNPKVMELVEKYKELVLQQPDKLKMDDNMKVTFTSLRNRSATESSSILSLANKDQPLSIEKGHNFGPAPSIGKFTCAGCKSKRNASRRLVLKCQLCGIKVHEDCTSKLSAPCSSITYSTLSRKATRSGADDRPLINSAEFSAFSNPLLKFNWKNQAVSEMTFPVLKKPKEPNSDLLKKPPPPPPMNRPKLEKLEPFNLTPRELAAISPRIKPKDFCDQESENISTLDLKKSKSDLIAESREQKEKDKEKKERKQDGQNPKGSRRETPKGSRRESPKRGRSPKTNREKQKEKGEEEEKDLKPNFIGGNRRPGSKIKIFPPSNRTPGSTPALHCNVPVSPISLSPSASFSPALDSPGSPPTISTPLSARSSSPCPTSPFRTSPHRSSSPSPSLTLSLAPSSRYPSPSHLQSLSPSPSSPSPFPVPSPSLSPPPSSSSPTPPSPSSSPSSNSSKKLYQFDGVGSDGADESDVFDEECDSDSDGQVSLRDSSALENLLQKSRKAQKSFRWTSASPKNRASVGPSIMTTNWENRSQASSRPDEQIHLSCDDSVVSVLKPLPKAALLKGCSEANALHKAQSNQLQSSQLQPNQPQPNQLQPNQLQPNQLQPNQLQPNQLQPQSHQPQTTKVDQYLEYCRQKLSLLTQEWEKTRGRYDETQSLIQARTTRAVIPQPMLKSPIGISFSISHAYQTTIFMKCTNTFHEAVEKAFYKLKTLATIVSESDRASAKEAGEEPDKEEEELCRNMNILEVKDIIVKLVGRNIFILNLHEPIHSFTFIRDAFERSKRPCLLLRQRKTAIADQPGSKEELPTILKLQRTGLTAEEKVTEKQFRMIRFLEMNDSHLDFETRTEKCYVLKDLPLPFALRLWECNCKEEHISSLFGRSQKSQLRYFVELRLYQGVHLLRKPVFSSRMSSPQWNGEWLPLDINCDLLPREVKLTITFYLMKKSSEKDLAPTEARLHPDIKPLGSVNVNLFSYNGILLKGKKAYKLWTGRGPNPIAMTAESPFGNSPTVSIEMFSPPHEMNLVFAKTPQHALLSRPELEKGTKPDGQEYVALKKVHQSDPLYRLSLEEKALLWKYRKYFRDHHPSVLPKIVQAMTWTPENVDQLHSLMEGYPVISPERALELLGASYPDSVVQAYAVKCVSFMTDNELAEYMLQIVQTLKYEPYHSSPLANFLVLRALESPNLIGQTLFWHLHSEEHNDELATRFRLLKKQLQKALPSQKRDELTHQMRFMRELEGVAKSVKGTEKRDLMFTTNMKKCANYLESSDPVTLPLDASIQVKGIVLPKCKILTSNTVPLWLVFENADHMADNVYTIVKTGDDLRQDILILQILSFMDHLWKEHCMDLHMIPYKCVATGHKAGMLEIVLNSKTMADIHKEIGGGALGAFNVESIEKWLLKHNPSSHEYEMCRKEFTRSCAGYCVATYVLGIGDRHNDNIMIQKSGNMFHIDFGYILGNFLKFAGVERETTPFVLTAEMVRVIGGEKGVDSPEFADFEDLCTKAYNILRRECDLLLTLFSMMLSTGIDQLTHQDDLEYLRKSLQVGATDSVAAKHFHVEMGKALNNVRVYMNNFLHILANN